MPEIVLWDTEFTTWEGAMERNWDGDGEHREVFQLAALRFDVVSGETKDTFECLLKPVANPVLSDYAQELTGVTQSELLSRGLTTPEALANFAAFAGGRTCWSYGDDMTVIKETCIVQNITNPLIEANSHNLKPLLQQRGVAIENYSSGTLY